GPRLFGSVVRHVAVLDGAWVALAGYGSAVLRCTARDRVIGWADADRVDRLPGDYLRLRNQIVLAAETFTDPARHTGACYAAAGFACAGSTRGYARGA